MRSHTREVNRWGERPGYRKLATGYFEEPLSIRFDEPGKYQVWCAPHLTNGMNMYGGLTVLEA